MSLSRRGRAVAGAAVAGAMLTTAACGSGSSGSDEEIVIGSVQSLSGAAASYGGPTQAGFDYIIDKINKSGGITSMGGAKIRVEVADSGSDPTKAASEARRLAGQEKASILMGTLQTPEMAAMAPVAKQSEIPVMALYAGSSANEQFYSIGLPYDDGYAGTMADFTGWIKKDKGRGIKTAAIAAINSEAGQKVAKALERRLGALGIKVVENVPMAPGDSNYKPALTKIVAAKPDVVFGMLLTGDGITFEKARAAVGADLLVVGSAGGFADPPVWEGLDRASRDVMAKNTFSVTTFSPEANENAKKLLAEAKAAGVKEPLGDKFVQGAQAAWMISQALEKAGKNDRGAILEALGKVTIAADSEELYLPAPDGLRFDNSTRMLVRQPTLVFQWGKDGSRDVVYPASLAKTAPEFTP